MSRTITFFVTEPIEALTVAAVAEEADRRGHGVQYEHRLDAEADVGLYVTHATEIPAVNARFSMIMLHDLGQLQVAWPHFWRVEPWDRFDVGLLPGPAWFDMYESCVGRPDFRGPRFGAYDVGWPKSDRVVAAQPALAAEAAIWRNRLGMPPGKTVLYAPSYENDGKQDDVVRACAGLDANLLIKHASWPDRFPERIVAIDDAERRHRGRHPRVFILDRNVDIMTALAMADLLVTDESNVQFEALLFGIPALSVQDWLVPCESPPRPVKARHEFAVPTTRAMLERDLGDLLRNGFNPARLGKSCDLAAYRDRWFSHRGRSAAAVIDLMEWLAGSSPGAQSAAGPRPAINKLESEMQTLQHWRIAVEQSASWRWSAPLRRMADTWTRRKKGRTS